MVSLGERDVRVAGGRIVRTAAYGVPGGYPVIWHHGNPGSRVAPFSDDALRQAGVRLIAYDRPGGGRSDPLPGRRIATSGPDVAAIADAWGVERFATAGFSGGGSFALATAALLGDRVLAAAVLAGAAPIDADGLDFTAGMADATSFVSDDEFQQRRSELLAELEPTRQAILADPFQALRDFVAEWPDADREASNLPEVAVPVAEGMAECVRISAEGWLDDSAAFHRSWGFDVRDISVPVAIWHGRDDVAAPISHGRWLAERIPDCAFNQLDGGHYAAYLAIDDVLRWLRSHPGES